MWKNKKGEEVHEDLVPLIDKLKHELVEDIIGLTEDRKKDLVEHKRRVLKMVEDYMMMLRERYEIDGMQKAPKGNISLETYDGCKKIQISVQTHIDFDEKLTLAKEKLDQFLTAETKGSTPTIKTLITRGFEVDKKGSVNAKKILELKGYPITDPLWMEAMAMIDEAIEIVGSKSYIRFYKRENVEDKWKHVSLDFAAIEEK